VAGATTPILYFGVQIAIGLATDGYSFLHDTASELGQRGAPHPTLFSIGAILTGVAAIAAAVGIVLAEQPGPGRRVLCLLALTSTGVGSIAAGVYPMPDSRHGGGPLGAGLFLLPFVLLAVTWPVAGCSTRAVLIVGVMWFVAAGFVMSGATPIDQNVYEGICQRFLAVPLFFGIGVSANRFARPSTLAG
jgi:hypothetical membrane protein